MGEDGGGGPDGVEAVGESHDIKLVNLDAIVVVPDEGRGRVDGVDGEDRLGDALRDSEAVGAAAAADEVDGCHTLKIN
jgi:hypothetical protein